MILVYLAHSLPAVVRQVLFSLTSCLHHMPASSPLHIVVYTDYPAILTDFCGAHPLVEPVSITPHQLRHWRGAVNFVHRAKVAILLEAGTRYPGPLVCCDGDTFFRGNPLDLFGYVNDQTSLMHTAEYVLEQGTGSLPRKLCRFVTRHTFPVAGAMLRIPPSTVMWNSGVVGLSATHKALLPLVLELTEQTYRLYPKHVMEQLAFSYYLQTHSTVQAADHVVGHYWKHKPAFQAAIDHFLAENPRLDQALEAYPHFAWPSLPVASTPKRRWPRWLKF